jgi:hypothetical protein
MPFELEQTMVQTIPPAQLFSSPAAAPADPVPSFQDIDSDSDSDDEHQDWDAVVAAGQ